MKLVQVSFTAGEISPSLHARVDLQRFTSALATCRNFFVRPQGGVSNRAGTRFIYQLEADSDGSLIPFIRSEDDAYMLVLQEENAKVFKDQAYVSGTTKTVTNITSSLLDGVYTYTVTTSTSHTFLVGDTAVFASVSPETFNGLNAIINATPSASTFKFASYTDYGAYVSGGTVTKALALVTPYQSDELAAIRYTQSADVLTLAHRGYFLSEITRTSATNFTFAAISDIETGPFLDLNDTATTLKSSAATGNGVTLTASTSIFNANHIGALVLLRIEDLSAIPPWEAAKAVTSGNHRLSNGKVYEALNSATTGTVAPSHDELSQFDGAAGVEWEYKHSLYGVARITAQAGTTATANIISYIPVAHPDTTTKWAFGAWSEEEGYPGVVTYFGDRLVTARSINQPQGQWASKAGDYHNFSQSSPLQDDDAITQIMNNRQTNAIVEMAPLEQLISLTANSSWASPNRGESWSPQTIGFFPQSYYGAMDLRSVIVGDNAIFAERGGRRLRELKFEDTRGKFGGAELTVLARHLFEATGDTIVDMDYAKDPDGILWMVLASGKLVGMTYLPEQEVIAFHRHDTDGYFERVCVIPENGLDAVYFIVRRTVNDTEVRYLERLADRTDDELDAFFIDCGLSYDGRNATATTIRAEGSTYAGGDTIDLHTSDAQFVIGDIGDAIQFGEVQAIITDYVHSQRVEAELQAPLPAALQNLATTEWTFARDTFSGLDHLEGSIVTGLADGNAIDPDDTTTAGVVTAGQLVLNYPAGVVHLGLAYTQDIETLNMNVTGSGQIRSNAKIVPKVSIVVLNTAGLKCGPDENNLEEIASRAFEGYTESTRLQTGVQTAYMLSTWDKESSILIRQPYPKPATVLAVIPTVVVGGDG